jgi:hypothetical protein
MFDKGLSALHPGILQFADLLRVEPPPFFAIVFPIEVEDGSGFNEIDEGIADIALILGVYREIEEVVLVPEVFVDLVDEQGLVVFVGNIFYHDGRAFVRLDEPGVHHELVVDSGDHEVTDHLHEGEGEVPV